MGKKKRQNTDKWVHTEHNKELYIEHLDEAVYGRNMPYLMLQYVEGDPNPRELRMSSDEYEQMKQIFVDEGWEKVPNE
jgi:hypothetical protein